MSQNHSGNIQPTIDREEHDASGGIDTKKALLYGWDSSGSQKVRIAVNASGQLLVDSSGSGGLVNSITGTASQILANGTSGSAQTGAVTLTLPNSVLVNTKLSVGVEDTMTVNGSAITSQLAVHSDTLAIIESHSHSNTAGFGGVLYGARSRGTDASETAVQSGDTLFTLGAVGYDGTDYATSSAIIFSVDGTPGSNVMPGKIGFYTSPSGSQTLTEGMRLDANQVLLLPKDGITTTSTQTLALQNTTAATSGVTEQYSPAQDFIGHSWKSGLGAADRTVRFRTELRTTTGSTPVGTLTWRSSVDTGTASFATNMALTSAGLLTITSLTVSGLTDTRVPFATTGGLLTDSAGMTFDSGNKILFVGQHSGKINDANLPIQSSTGGASTAAYWGFNKSGAYGMLMGYSEGLNGWTGPVFRCVTSDSIYFITNNTATALTISSAQLATFFGAVVGNTTITATTSLKTPLVTPISTEAILIRGYDATVGTLNGSKVTIRGGKGFNDGESISNGADVEIYGGAPGFSGTVGGAVIFRTDGSTVLTRFTDLNTFAVKAGGSTTIARSGTGTLAQYIADATVGGAEADIFSFTTAASTLGTNGDRLTAVYGGNFVTVGTELTQLKVYFAGTAIWDSTGVAPTTGTTSWRVNVDIIRVSSSVVRYTVSLNTTGASGYVYAVSGELTGLTLSNTNILKITGTSSGVGSGSGDIVGKMGYVEWSPSIAS